MMLKDSKTRGSGSPRKSFVVVCVFVSVLVLSVCVVGSDAFFESFFQQQGGGAEGNNQAKAPEKPIDFDCYLCSNGKTCVKDPFECPCKDSISKKCILGDWYACLSTKVECDLYSGVLLN
eukprot:Nk52_evm12s270 gene=Nk52_evmTU12s270